MITRAPHHILATLVYVVEQQSGLTAPRMDPYALSAALGIVLLPSVGAAYALRGAQLTYDPRWHPTQRAKLIARACAVHALWGAGLLRRSHPSDVQWLTRALCGCDADADMVVEPSSAWPLLA